MMQSQFSTSSCAYYTDNRQTIDVQYTNCKNENENIMIIDPEQDQEQMKILHLLQQGQQEEENLANLYSQSINNKIRVQIESYDNNLENLLKSKTTPFNQSEVLNIMRQTAKGYRYCFLKQIIHKHLELSNILVKDKIYKLSGFIDGEIVTGMRINSCRRISNYTAPELISSSQRCSTIIPSKVDIYSLGVIFYQLLTKELPSNSMPISCFSLQQIIPGLNYELGGLICSMLERNEKDRISWPKFFKNRLINNPIKLPKQPIILVKLNKIEIPFTYSCMLPSAKNKYGRFNANQSTAKKMRWDQFIELLKNKQQQMRFHLLFNKMPIDENMYILQEYIINNKYEFMRALPFDYQMDYQKDYLNLLVDIYKIMYEVDFFIDFKEKKNKKDILRIILQNNNQKMI